MEIYGKLVNIYEFFKKLIKNYEISSDMVIRSIGNSLMVILPDLVGKKITNCFDLVRPLIAFKFQNVSNTSAILSYL